MHGHQESYFFSQKQYSDGILYFVANQCIDNFIEILISIFTKPFMVGVFLSETKLVKVVPIL